MAREITYRYADPIDLSASDLREAAIRYGKPCRGFLFTIWDENRRQMPETAQAVYLPDERRVGIAWGADAEWGDVDSTPDHADEPILAAIMDWLNDADAWAARN